MKVTFGESIFVSFVLVFKSIALWNSYSRTLFSVNWIQHIIFESFLLWSISGIFFCLLILNVWAVCKKKNENVAAMWIRDKTSGKWKRSRGQKIEQEKTWKLKKDANATTLLVQLRGCQIILNDMCAPCFGVALFWDDFGISLQA